MPTMPTTPSHAFDLPAPTLILVGAGTQSLPDKLPARAAFCSPLTSLRLEVAEARGLMFSVPVLFVSAGRGLVAPDQIISGGEQLLIDPELAIETHEVIINQLDKMNTSIVELHGSQHIILLVSHVLQVLAKPHKITLPRLPTTALSGVFRAYKDETCKSST